MAAQCGGAALPDRRHRFVFVQGLAVLRGKGVELMV